VLRFSLKVDLLWAAQKEKEKLTGVGVNVAQLMDDEIKPLLTLA
jgi:hypothetical protein